MTIREFIDTIKTNKDRIFINIFKIPTEKELEEARNKINTEVIKDVRNYNFKSTENFNYLYLLNSFSLKELEIEEEKEQYDNKILDYKIIETTIKENYIENYNYEEELELEVDGVNIDFFVE